MLAIVGFGNHVNKNVLPALTKMDNVTISYVVVRDVNKYKALAPFNFTSDFDLVLQDESVKYIYIATPISSHFEFAKKAILASKHVLCEKVLTPSDSETNTLMKLADENNVFLQEVVMYFYHKQFNWLLENHNSLNLGKLRKVTAKFQIPKLAESDIRYSKKLCGGALLDVGFYPLSFIQGLLGDPDNLTSCLIGEKTLEVDLFGAAIMTYENVIAIAEWGIGAVYKNEALLEFEKGSLLLERAFSKPPQFESTVCLKDGFGKAEQIKIGCDDHFFNMFTSFFSLKIKNDLHVNQVKARSTLISKILTESKFTYKSENNHT